MENLPRDLLTYLISYLDLCDLNSLNQSCKKYNGLMKTNEDDFWKVMYMKRWPKFQGICSDWKSAYSNRRDNWKQAIVEFNKDESSAIEILQKEGLVDENLNGIVPFLKENCKMLNRRKISWFLTEPEVMQLGILSDYMKSFDLKEVPLDDAYRLLFQYILFPASNTRIREIIKEFSHFYYLSNEHLNIFQSEDSVVAISYAMNLLNTDLHSNSIRLKLTIEQFTSALRGQNNGHDYPSNFLEMIYNGIKVKPLITLQEIIIQLPEQTSLWSRLKSKMSNMYFK